MWPHVHVATGAEYRTYSIAFNSVHVPSYCLTLAATEELVMGAGKPLPTPTKVIELTSLAQCICCDTRFAVCERWRVQYWSHG